MVVAEGDGKRVRDVHWLRRLDEAELAGDRPLHLLLARSAGPGHRLLDPRRAIADNRQAALRGSEEDHATGMRHQDRRARMLVMRVKLLDRHRGRLELREDLAQFRIDRMDARRERALAFLDANDARLHERRPAE